ncbi:MAG: GIY-YIG nuclease family protein [Bradyrhizobium sp.]|uniref:GIY-YIG nuclease family protein n=1 Tax=Bradyrhizobium sp. TaxID=376 RepID=UPI0029A9CFB4|nr:GIY-YIG nuclease family protein [Bradyrhizobium sp.]MDX3971936.1 GIY-YIG nuclease family protein [Bradyrhizobium sp.]
MSDMSNVSQARGRSIRMFLVDGSPTGLIVAEIVNWTGKIIVVPRSALASFLKRREAQNTGVYILSGQDPNDPFRSQVYVGESEFVGQRLRQHDSDEQKDFFERAFVLISKDENLTKSHARHLEEQLERRIRASGRATVMQTNKPGGSALPEADVSDMEFFLDQIEVVLPVLGLDILRPIPSAAASDEKVLVSQRSTGAQFVFEIGSVKAYGMEIDGEFVVKAGSLARDVETPTLPKAYRALREKLKADGSLKPTSNQMLTFAQDVPFDSPSAAAAAVYGASISGPANWKADGTGRTYADLRREELADAEAASKTKDEAGSGSSLPIS